MIKELENKANTLKISDKIFLALLVFNIVLGLFFGLLALLNFRLVLELNQTTYSDKLLVFGVVSGTAIIFLASILILSFIWTIRRKWEGPVIGIFAAMYLLMVGILTWVYTGNPGAFYIDSFRGLFTIIFGYLTYSNFKN